MLDQVLDDSSDEDMTVPDVCIHGDHDSDSEKEEKDELAEKEKMQKHEPEV